MIMSKQSDQHLQDRHGPILTRGDLERAETEHAAQCQGHIAKATEIGKAHGKGAASWVFDGNTSTKTYRRVLDGLEEGDPEIYDSLKVCIPNLNGEYTETDLWSDCDLDPEDPRNVIASADASDAYEEAAAEAFWLEVERVARYHLEP
jgi:hypothetical protein